jgi:hypothetical protein
MVWCSKIYSSNFSSLRYTQLISLFSDASQVHAPLSIPSNPPSDLNLLEYDGAAEIELTSPLLLLVTGHPDADKSIPKWVREYYQEIVLVDERRILVSEAMVHMRPIEEGNVQGTRWEIMKDGEVMIEVDEEKIGVWRGYENRGKAKVT